MTGKVEREILQAAEVMDVYTFDHERPSSREFPGPKFLEVRKRLSDSILSTRGYTVDWVPILIISSTRRFISPELSEQFDQLPGLQAQPKVPACDIQREDINAFFKFLGACFCI